MKTLLLFGCLVVVPLVGQGQADTLQPAQTEPLRPITSEHFPTYSRYGGGHRTRFQYDGIDTRPVALKPYIMASGDPEAIANFSRYLERRETGHVLYGVGSAILVTGLAMTIVARSAPDSSNPWVTGSSRTSSDGPSGAAGFVVGMLGAAVMAIGAGESTPTSNKHLRRAVQYYNRSLQRRGISWQLAPYGSANSNGLALVGRF